jgi:hypothetical protein
MSGESAFQERVEAAEESHRLRIVLARVLQTAEENRARAEYHCTFENAGWDRKAFQVYRAVMAFAEGSYARAATESVRMKYAEVVMAWVECKRSTPALCSP